MLHIHCTSTPAHNPQRLLSNRKILSHILPYEVFLYSPVYNTGISVAAAPALEYIQYMFPDAAL